MTEKSRRKYRLENFVFYDYAGIQEHLQRMASRGWMLESITPFFWRYRRSTPQKVSFAVTYFPEASDFDPGPTENQQLFLDLCAQEGWQLAAQWAQMQILYTHRENPLPLQTDAGRELRAIHAAMKKNFLPSSFLLLFLSVFQLIIQGSRVVEKPLETLSEDTVLFVLLLWFIMLLLQLLNLGGYLRWYVASQKSIEATGQLAKSRNLMCKFGKWVLALVLVIVPFWIWDMAVQQKSFLVLYGIALSAGILTVLFSVQGLLKRLKAPKEINQVFTLAAAFLAGIGISIFGGSMMLQQLSSDDPQVLSVVQPDGGIVEYPIYDDPVLLRLEDLQDTPDAYYSRVSEEKTSVLFRVAWGLQQGMDSQGRKLSEMYYCISETGLPLLRQFCREKALDLGEYAPQGQRWEPYSLPQWELPSLYRLYDGEKPEGYRYAVCWEDRTVILRMESEPSQQQLTDAFTVLGKA